MIFVQQYHTTLFTCQATIIIIIFHRKRSLDYICTASIVNKNMFTLRPLCLISLFKIIENEIQNLMREGGEKKFKKKTMNLFLEKLLRATK